MRPSLPCRSLNSVSVSPRMRTDLTGFWLKYLDLYLDRQPNADDAASGFYFLGRRSETPISDRDVIESYR